MLKVHHFFDVDTSTLTYVVFDEISKDAVIIDPVLDYDPASGKVTFTSLKLLLSFISEHQLNPHLILETHAHADHLTSAQYLKEKFPSLKVGIGKRITEVQKTFKAIYNLGDTFKANGNEFDLLLEDFVETKVGTLSFKTIPTAGHTPACISFLFENKLFTGDALFMPDSGTGRTDFPGGSAQTLYQAIYNNLYSLPNEIEVYVGHDYQPGNRELKFKTTIGDSKANNIHIKSTTDEKTYVDFREGRDKTLKAPRLLFQSLQVNIRGGHLPDKESNQKSYLKMPLFVERS